MTNPEGLARLERMAQRARVRREADLAVERDRERAERVQRARDELRETLEHFLDGPPGGCVYCYVWSRGKFGWHWSHLGAISPVARPLYDDDPESVCEWCTHFCHGSDGLPLPLIALAAGP